MPVKQRFAAVERSIDLVRMTDICASAKIIRMELSLKACAKFLGVANSADLVATPAIKIAMASANSISRDLNRRAITRQFPPRHAPIVRHPDFCFQMFQRSIRHASQ